jgi:hypothetical protein
MTREEEEEEVVVATAVLLYPRMHTYLICLSILLLLFFLVKCAAWVHCVTKIKKNTKYCVACSTNLLLNMALCFPYL